MVHQLTILFSRSSEDLSDHPVSSACCAKARVPLGKPKALETQDGNTLMLFLHLSINPLGQEVDCSLRDRAYHFHWKAQVAHSAPVATWASGSKW